MFVAILTIHFVRSRTASASRELSQFPKNWNPLGRYLCLLFIDKQKLFPLFFSPYFEWRTQLALEAIYFVSNFKAYDNADRSRTIPRKSYDVIDAQYLFYLTRFFVSLCTKYNMKTWPVWSVQCANSNLLLFAMEENKCKWSLTALSPPFRISQ